ncbi:MAG: sulfotransferase [Pseudomonadota bacterium]
MSEQYNKQSKLRYVYISAASHSGSTLMALLLGSQPNVTTAGELKVSSLRNLAEYRCSCRELILECNFWNDVIASMQEKGRTFDFSGNGASISAGLSDFQKKLLKPLLRAPALERLRDLALAITPGWRRHLREFREQNLALMTTIAELSQARTIVDSSKIAIRAKYLNQIPGIDFRVLRLVRDGRGAAIGYLKPGKFADADDPELRGGGTGTEADPHLNNMASAAREWRRSTEEAQNLIDSLRPEQVRQVKYEQLCSDPEGTLRSLADFVGFTEDEMTLNFRSKVHHVIGNGMRLNDSSQITLDERWRNELTKADLKVFDEVAGDTLRLHGYQ